MTDKSTERLQMRVSKAFLKSLDGWRRKQPDLPSRSAAIKRLVQLSIRTKKLRRPVP